MAKEITMPKLGQTMEEGTVVNCLVKVGDEVKKGDVIGRVGSTGNSHAPHLHLALKIGAALVDPTQFIEAMRQP